jgi:lipopolysaccharide/colanic/teichoic acid biosynthesis glycosyltransferase
MDPTEPDSVTHPQHWLSFNLSRKLPETPVFSDGSYLCIATRGAEARVLLLVVAAFVVVVFFVVVLILMVVVVLSADEVVL